VEGKIIKHTHRSFEYIQVEKQKGIVRVRHTYNLSTQEAEAGGSQVSGQHALYSKILTEKKKGKQKEKQRNVLEKTYRS
jgi:hypothetical protein